jgi:hypothetical protein
VSVYDPPLLHSESPQLLNFYLNANPYPVPAFDFDEDPDPAFHADADPDQASCNYVDRDPNNVKEKYKIVTICVPLQASRHVSGPRMRISKLLYSHIQNRTLDPAWQCCGSVKFQYGSGSADPYHCLTDPDPPLFVSGSQDAIKNRFLF